MRSFQLFSVSIFCRLADMNIDNWIYQIKTFIRACSIQEKYRVLFLVCRIYSSHFEEIKPHLKMNLPYFVREFRRIFCAPNLTQARLTKLSAMSTDGDRHLTDFRERIRQLRFKVSSTMSVEDVEKMAATRYHSGISDSEMALNQLDARVTHSVPLIERSSSMANGAES